MTELWGKIVEQGSELLLHGKVVRVVLMILMGLFVWHYMWAAENFVTQNDFQVLVEKFDGYQKKADIVAAGNLKRDREIQLQIAEAVGAPDKTVQALKDDVLKAQAYQDCLVYEQGKCEYIQPRD